MDITNPSNLPDPSEVDYMEEPIVSAEIMVTTEFVGAIMKLCQERRGNYLGMEYMETTRALLKYELPLNEIIYDFFDALKSRSKGYASFDYELKGYERAELALLSFLLFLKKLFLAGDIAAVTFCKHILSHGFYRFPGNYLGRRFFRRGNFRGFSKYCAKSWFFLRMRRLQWNAIREL